VELVEEPIVDPLPPGAAPGWSFSGVPWWLVGIIATIAFIGFQILTKPKWQEGFMFIKGGVTLTLIVTLGGFVIAVVLGLIIGLARLSHNKILQNLAMYYIEVIRGVPVLVTILFVSIVAFGQGSQMIGFDAPNKALRGTLALGIIYAAFIAEVFRAGIESIPSGQREAGMSIGLSKRQVLRFIVLPQAVKNIMPALGNDLIALLKDSSLVSVIAVRELTQMTKLWTGSSFRFMEGYLILTAFYLTLTVSLSLLLRWYERHISTPGR
jgi:polar amino acid transport system permease protein